MTSRLSPTSTAQRTRLCALLLTLASLAGCALLAAPGVAQAAAPTVVSIQFDDGISNQYQAGAILAQYGMHGTFYINSAELGTSGFYMTMAQVHDLAAAGNEIGGHTLHHPDLTTLSTADATTEICDDRTALVNQGFAVSSFAYPYGHTNAAIEQIARGCGYSSARGVTGVQSPGGCTVASDDSCGYAESLPPVDPYLTRTPENVSDTTTLADMEADVTQAEQHGGGWVQMVFHDICDADCDEYSTSAATFSAFLAWLQPRTVNGTVVKTTADALAGTSTDHTSPTVSLTAPAANASVSNTVLLGATAADNVAVSKVEFYRGTTLLGTTATSPYSYSWDSNTVANGTYSLTAKAYDAAGNSTTSAPVTVTVANANAHQTIVTLGFDDGDADQYQTGAMLASHGMHATYYINSGRINATSYMTLAQIQALQTAGNEIAGHTVTHADLPTLDVPEQTRQICNDRVALLNLGFPVRSFAYPYGDFNATTEQIAASCGYDNARTIGGLVTPTSCTGCATSVATPPADLYSIPTPDSIKSTMPLSQIEGYVLQAEAHGGGMVPLVMHHVADDCGTDEYCVTTSTLDAFLTWLQARAPQGTVVQELGNVIGGPVNPGVAGPPAPPAAGGANLLQNQSLEVDANNDLTPDCWQLGGYGTNTATWTRSSDAQDGSFSELLSMSAFTDGDRRLITRQDLGSCSPSVTPGHTYTVSAYYKTTGNANSRIVVYTRSATGTWVFFAQQPAALAQAAGWTKTTLTTPAVPAGTTALSIGMSLRSTGTLAMDDFTLADTDQTPPTVALSSPTDGSSVTGSLNLTANATDASGIAKVDFLVNGNVVGSSTTAPYSFSWDSHTVSGTASIAARATDTAGNVATSASSLVTVSNPVDDTTPPVSTATCDAGPCAGAHGAGTLVALSATDAGSGVAEIVYTIDGSTPSLASTVYTGAFAVSTNTTVKYRAYDVAGNQEAVNSTDVAIDTTAPAVSATCNGAACSGVWQNGPASIALSATDAGVGVDRIVYTTDGSEPSASNGTVYAAPFQVLASATVRYRAFDLVGNVSDSQTALIRIDTVAPSTTATCDTGACSPAWSTTPISVTLSATDDSSGVDRIVYTTDGSDPTPASTLANGPIVVTNSEQIRFRSYDVAGNAEPVGSLSLNVDGQAPASAVSCNGAPCNAATTYNAPLSVALSASDAGSGVAQIYYTTDGSTPSAASGTLYSGPLALSDSTTLSYRAYDVAGNAEAPNTLALTVSTTPVDTTAPVTTASCSDGQCASWHTGPLSVTLGATDDLSGVAKTVYTTNGSDPSLTNGTTYGAPIGITATTNLRFRSYDAAGNAEAIQSVNVRVDSTIPVATAKCGTATCPTTWSKTPLSVTLAATDTGSGVSQIVYTTDGSAPTLAHGTVYTGPIAVTSAETLSYRAYDVAGNAGAIGSLALKVDAIAPASAATCGGGDCSAAWYGSPLGVVLTASDAGSGIASIRYTTNGTDPTTTSTAYSKPLALTSTAQIRFRAYDVAGNAGAVTTLKLSIDSTLPVTKVTCNGVTCPTAWQTSARTVVLSATDTGSGVARIVYTTDGSTPTAAHGSSYTTALTVSKTTTIAFIAIDVAGNTSAVKTVALKVDTVAPSLTVSSPGAGTVTGTVRVAGTASDDQTLASIIWYLDGRALQLRLEHGDPAQGHLAHDLRPRDRRGRQHRPVGDDDRDRRLTLSDEGAPRPRRPLTRPRAPGDPAHRPGAPSAESS
jgi:peptidoglycan/xylan/chitin deacetylase (PgdA/CDA1 family)